MTIPHYDTVRDRPLLDDDAIIERLDHLLEAGLVLRLWFMFLDDAGIQLPLLLPMDVIDSPDDGDVESVARFISDLADATDAAAVVLVVEWGEQDSPQHAAEWMQVALAASLESGRPFRGPFECSPSGVRVAAA